MKDDHFWDIAVRLHVQRSALIASNLANAETPNYKARDFDFKVALEKAVSDGEALAMTTSSSDHIASGAPDSPELAEAPEYRIPQQPSLDGNTVEMEVERAAFVENAMRYEFAVRHAVDEYKEIGDLFKSLTI